MREFSVLMTESYSYTVLADEVFADQSWVTFFAGSDESRQTVAQFKWESIVGWRECRDFSRLRAVA